MLPKFTLNRCKLTLFILGFILTLLGCKKSVDYSFDEIPTADFEYSAFNGVVTFTNLSTNYKAAEWDFGDGNTSTDIHPKHSFQVGTYEIKLRVNNGIDTAEISQRISFQFIDSGPIINEPWAVGYSSFYPNIDLGKRTEGISTYHFEIASDKDFTMPYEEANLLDQPIYPSTFQSSKTLIYGLKPSTEYWYRVREVNMAVDSNEVTRYSEVAYVKTNEFPSFNILVEKGSSYYIKVSVESSSNVPSNTVGYGNFALDENFTIPLEHRERNPRKYEIDKVWGETIYFQYEAYLMSDLSYSFTKQVAIEPDAKYEMEFINPNYSKTGNDLTIDKLGEGQFHIVIGNPNKERLVINLMRQFPTSTNNGEYIEYRIYDHIDSLRNYIAYYNENGDLCNSDYDFKITLKAFSIPNTALTRAYLSFHDVHRFIQFKNPDGTPAAGIRSASFTVPF